MPGALRRSSFFRQKLRRARNASSGLLDPCSLGNLPTSRSTDSVPVPREKRAPSTRAQNATDVRPGVVVVR